jgi:N-acetylglucosamine kinase-like BadF-type ATPase
MKYYLGVDIGSSKTQALLADESGFAVGAGQAGPGNHQTVGYEGMAQVLEVSVQNALEDAGVSRESIHGAGFGISGYDWPSDKPSMVETISRLNLVCPLDLHNDAVLGLLAGATDGWGLAVVSGTGCNCWGWDRSRNKIGHMTGFGDMAGEAAGATELVYRAMQLVTQAWTLRGPATGLSQALVAHSGAKDIEDLIEGYTTNRYQVGADAAPLIFQIAEQGDKVASELVDWAGRELGELANAVIRQLNFQALTFDVVMVGSMFDAGQRLIEPMRETIIECAPSARIVKLNVPPVVGAVLMGMEAAGINPYPKLRNKLEERFI